MASDMDHAVGRCDGCGGVLEPRNDDESLVIYDCFHVLHAGCAHGRDACPRCHTPRRVHDDDDDDDDQPEQVDEATPAASLPPAPDNNPDEDSALASDGVGVGKGNDDHLGCCACCSCRVAELEIRFQDKSSALIETTNALESELERAKSRLCRLEEMYEKLEGELIRLRDNGKRARQIEDAQEERKKPRDGGKSPPSSFPQTGPD